MNFDLCTPISWSDIIAMGSIIMTFITAIIAIIIAVIGNKLSKKQLQVSQQQLNDALKIHEQSKNIDLYDKRLNTVCTILKNADIDYIEVELLFSKSLSERANEISTLHHKINNLIGLLNEFKSMNASECNTYNNGLKEKVQKSLKNQFNEFKTNYMEFCSSYDVKLMDVSIDNIAEIEKQLEERSLINKMHKEELIIAFKEYIKKSLEPICKVEE